MNINYVQFIRGSSDAFNKLITKDSNTLYFITEGDSLKLYLGNTLIGSSDAEVSESSNLEDLLNVKISDVLSENDILMYNGNSWINTSLNDYKTLLDIPTIEDFPIMVGASNDIDDTLGEDGKSGLVPAPSAGEASYFLSGDGKWTNLSPIVSSEIDKMLEHAPDTLDTLQEIVDWIYDPENIQAEKLITRVGNLEEELKKINIENYITTNDFESRVGRLDNEEASLAALKTNNKNSLTQAVNELYDQLVWREITTDNFES